MKKIIALLLCITMFGGIASAQRAGEYNLYDEDWNHSGIFAEIGAGVGFYDYHDYDYYDYDKSGNSFGINVALGYRYHFENGIYWDAIKVSYLTTIIEDPACASYIALKTGFRYVSGPIIGEKPIYVNAGLGYGICLNKSYNEDGFAYEVGLGILLSRLISLGINFEGVGVNSVLGLKLGFNF